MPFACTRFHSVSQGCFCSGEIICTPNSDPLRIVNNCGSETAEDALERVVDLFHQIIHDTKLDMLVRSHLDADHWLAGRGVHRWSLRKRRVLKSEHIVKAWQRLKEQNWDDLAAVA
jgi:Cft2 family RNA processing exonuclease